MGTATIETPTSPKLTVGYQRKVAVRQYESAEASIFVQADIQGTWNDDGLFVPNDDAVKEAAMTAFFEAKVAVLNQLCLPYEVLDNVVVENIDKILGPVDVVQTIPAAAAHTQPTTSGGGDWQKNEPATKDALQNELLEHPERFFDNREGKKNPKAPDFKRKHTGGAIWLDKALPALREKYAA